MKKLLLLALSSFLIMAAPLWAADKIKVATTVGADEEILEVAKKVAAKDGLEVEIVAIDGYVLPNMALAEKQVDLNSFQHQPYLDTFNAERKMNLVSVGKTYIAPMAFFSSKIKSADELKNGDRVAIPNDPTNGGRALLMLQSLGKIKLKDGSGLTPTSADIVGNPLNLQIVEVDAPQTPRALDDVAMAAINNTFVAPAGLKMENALYREDENSPYVNVIVARPEDKDNPLYQKFVKAYQSPEVAEFIKIRFEGSTFPAF